MAQIIIFIELLERSAIEATIGKFYSDLKISASYDLYFFLLGLKGVLMECMETKIAMIGTGI